MAWDSATESYRRDWRPERTPLVDYPYIVSTAPQGEPQGPEKGNEERMTANDRFKLAETRLRTALETAERARAEYWQAFWARFPER